MTKEQAWQIIEQIASVYRGTLDEHKNIQTAINILKTPEVTQASEVAKKEDKK